jgi:hypothetical protein
LSSPSACPKCGATRPAEALECVTCGIVFSKYKGPRMSAEPSPEPVMDRAPERPANSEPEADTTEGVWRRGRTLIVSRLASLPDRCVSCNGPAETRLIRKLSWHQAWIYLFLLINLLVYVVAALVARKQAAVEVPLCGRHVRMRRYGVLGAWGLLVLGSGLAWALAAVTADADGLAAAAPILVFLGSALVALVVGFTISRPVVPRRIDDEFVWLGKVSKDFLASVPEAPTSV